MKEITPPAMIEVRRLIDAFWPEDLPDSKRELEDAILELQVQAGEIAVKKQAEFVQAVARGEVMGAGGDVWANPQFGSSASRSRRCPRREGRP
jgi:hypothetical protein